MQGVKGCKEIKGVNLRWPCKVEAENVVVVRLKWVASKVGHLGDETADGFH